MYCRADLFMADWDIQIIELTLKFFEGDNIGVAEQTYKNKDLWDVFETLWCFSVEKRTQACVVGVMMFYF